MSNSANMTFEDKVVQALKEDHLGKLLDDDALRKLVERAVDDLFKPRKQTQGYTTIERPSIVTEHVWEFVKTHVTGRLEKLFEGEDGAKFLREAFTTAAPAAIFAAIEGHTRTMMHNQSFDIRANAVQEIEGRLRARGVSI